MNADLATLRNLEASLAAATGLSKQLMSDLCEELLPASFTGVDEMSDEDLQLHAFIDGRAWLDAAVALTERVSPGTVWKLRGNNELVRGHTAEADLERIVDVGHGPQFVTLSCATSRTPALALCLAIVRAKIMEAVNALDARTN